MPWLIYGEATLISKKQKYLNMNSFPIIPKVLSDLWIFLDRWGSQDIDASIMLTTDNKVYLRYKYGVESSYQFAKLFVYLSLFQTLHPRKGVI
jgi:hypothetical protein